MMNCVRKRKNTHYPFTTENAANDGPVIFSSLFTTKALSPHHMAHAIKCVCKPQVERKLLTRKKKHFYTTNCNSASHRKTKERNKDTKGEREKRNFSAITNKILFLFLFESQWLQSAVSFHLRHYWQCSIYVIVKTSHHSEHEFIMLHLRKVTQNIKAFGANYQ